MTESPHFQPEAQSLTMGPGKASWAPSSLCCLPAFWLIPFSLTSIAHTWLGAGNEVKTALLLVTSGNSWLRGEPDLFLSSCFFFIGSRLQENIFLEGHELHEVLQKPKLEFLTTGPQVRSCHSPLCAQKGDSTVKGSKRTVRGWGHTVGRGK
jgi:hypothetical protein